MDLLNYFNKEPGEQEEPVSGLTFQRLAKYNLCPRYPLKPLDNNIQYNDIVFVNLDYFDNFIEQLLNINPENKFILITHNSDRSFTEEHLNKVTNYVTRIYAINCTIQNNKIIKIPIGLPDKHYPIQDIQHKTKDILIYCNFTINTNPSVRTDCLNIMNLKEFVTKEAHISQQEYYTKISRSKFVVSPEGTGIDCHRIYESLLLDTIPVVKSSALNDLYQNYPILIINNWSDLTEEYLNSIYPEYLEKLTTFNKNTLYSSNYIQIISKKYISFSLWGNHEFYNYGLYENVILAQKLLPDWTCLIWYKDIDPLIVLLLKQQSNTKLIDMSTLNPNLETHNYSNMMWRFIPAFNQGPNDVMISRDADSRINSRDILTIKTWLNQYNNKDFHILRDHKNHGTEILGGMWGSKNQILNKLKPEFDSYARSNIFGLDQRFLREVVYPYVINNNTAFIQTPPNILKWEPYILDIQDTPTYNSFIGSYCVSAPNLFRKLGLPNRDLSVPDRLLDSYLTQKDLFYFYK